MRAAPRFSSNARDRISTPGLKVGPTNGIGEYMDLKLSGKVAVVTGASRGIGRAIAQTLAAEGMKLSLAARSKDQLDELARSLKTDVFINAVDLREPDAPQAVV